ncbi:MAG: phospholipase D-like domain-containing protein [Candidatus Cyclonatronum sp.]|uniref:phospholipase D-like domain-containing anti-phage protein n=1 Tax=Cyclonatronum sp. TaxID=3024185 RepID=UPI0025B7E877|nr:phospholipase D-like domain-containing anti-phage protein [Cyclonatronum sp.]MCH8487760.1 phospholipase D-like domain-containing protein [Cyclonatronum sp.]
MIKRHSSRRSKLTHSVLKERLRDAVSYDRIAGYFTSGILEVAGEELEQENLKVRVICNSDLDIRDVQTAQAARNAQRKAWTNTIDPQIENFGKGRFLRLHELLRSGKMEVKVLPNEVFGLLHGKAGVIRKKDGRASCFIGSINESVNAWTLNYELVWEDESPEGVQWVQDEFDALWNHPNAVPLAKAVIDDVERLSGRKLVRLEEWVPESQPDAAAEAIIEEPVYRKENGLWDHQKYFVHITFREYIRGRKARYILGDMVGLGKTIQLALAAKLIAMHAKETILIIAPKTLLYQWQKEMQYLLDMPSAVWNGRQWEDELGNKYPAAGPKGILKCPRKVGIVSQGLFTAKSEAADKLLYKNFGIVIVDECHRARRKKITANSADEKPDPNNLMEALMQISKNCTHMLMGTATPVQLHPIEAHDLLNILAQGDHAVLGGPYSHWRNYVSEGLQIAKGNYKNLNSIDRIWNWLRDPLPTDDPYWTGDPLVSKIFESIRLDLSKENSDITINANALDQISIRRKKRLESDGIKLLEHYNPFISRIVRRSRSFLENEINPETKEAYLPKIEVRLFGESDADALSLPVYLEDAYKTAEEFCRALANRVKGAGFFKTLMLKRIGSSMESGLRTAEKLLNRRPEETLEEVFYEDFESEESDTETDEQYSELPNTAGESTRDYPARNSTFKNFTTTEIRLLEELINKLEEHKHSDPKYFKMSDILFNENWIAYGCIIFSQYFDTVFFMASRLSRENPQISIGQYVGSGRSGIWKEGNFTPMEKETLKKLVQDGQLKILFGTEAASEGLNLQRLGTLINLDLPWNPTKLEQRKGRIQRIGQLRDEIWIYNMRYKGSVEDRIHELLSERLEQIHKVFGQIPDILEDAWIQAAQGNIEEAKRRINALPDEHPFEIKYHRMHNIPWETVKKVLYAQDKRAYFQEGW